MSELDVVGHSHPQIDGMEKAMGKTRYVTDLVLPGMLHGRTLRSPYPHARILSIDTSKAEALLGVKAVATFADTPGIWFGPRSEDWTIFACDKARFHGDEIAAVAAVDAGDVDRALDDSYIVYKDRYRTNQVYQAYLEPMSCLADVDLSGRVTLWTGTQIPSMMRMTYAKALGVTPDHIRIIVPDYGGAFGAKMENNIHLVATILAQKSGKPVRLVNTRHEDFLAGNPRVPMYLDIKLGATRDGFLTGKETTVIGGSGSRLVYAMVIVSTACYRVDSLYRFQHVRSTGYTVYTNTVPTACFRGFGNAQMTFVLESAMDEIAHRLNIDPAEIRAKNGIGPNEVSVHGWKINSSALGECIEKAVEASDWRRKRQSEVPLKGIGLSCCNHVSGNRPFAREFDGGAGIVRIGRDGRVTVYHGESDMGQGQKTAFAQIVAERLGVSLQRVHVAVVDTDISPFGLGSFATRGTLMGGNGVLAAAANAFEQMAETAARLLGVKPEDVTCRKERFFVKGAEAKSVPFLEVAEEATFGRHGAPVVGTGYYDPKTDLPDPKTKYGNISPAYPFGCQIAEVEVDPDTGQVRVTDLVAAHDVGRAINPMATEGQIRGGVTQGLGWTLMEDMAYKDGKLLNPDFIDYVLPTVMDVPDIRPILVEPIEPSGPYGAKGIGEPALNPTMAAITNAIYHATGIRVKELPVSAEMILEGLKKQKPNSTS